MTVRRIVVLAAGAALVAAGALAGYATFAPGERRFEATDVTGVPWGKGFALTDHHGKPRTLADFRGKIVVLFFGFTHCPDVCPTTLADAAAVMKALGKDAARVQVLMVTVDPERDTAEVLSQYVPAFHPSFLGLRSDLETTERTTKAFKVYFKAHAANEHGTYMVDHSGSIFVFDPRGRLRLLMRGELPPGSMAHDFRLLLEQAS